MTPYSINKVLVPIDLSDPSLNALNAAVHIGKNHNAKVIILNVSESSFSGNDAAERISTKVNSDVITALIGTIHRATGVKPELFQKEGLVVDAIVTTAMSASIDLIVMGTHGASGFREGFMGSNTYNVIKHASCPVLSVPVRQKSPVFKKVLFPIRPVSGALKRFDIVCPFLSNNPIIDVLGLLSHWGEQGNGLLNKIVQEIDDDLPEGKVKVKTHWAEGSSIVDNILEFAQKNESDLIVLTSGIDAVSKTNYIGPYAQRLLNFSNICMLSVKQPGIPMFV